MNSSKENASRVVKPHTPPLLIVSVVVGALLLLTGIFFAISTMQSDITAARMTGTITAKNFESRPAQEITLGDNGLRSSDVAGTFTLTVAVRQTDGSNREFTVWVPEPMYNSVNIGDSFDVGPYLVPEARTPSGR